MGTVFLYEVMSKSAMDDWRNQPEDVLKWKDHHQNVTQFVLDESYQVTVTFEEIVNWFSLLSGSSN